MNDLELSRLVSDGVDKAKAGQGAEMYALVSPYHDASRLASNSHYPFGWIIYYALHQAGEYEIAKRKQMLARYLKLQNSRPHKLHSMILTEAIRLYKDAIALRDMPDSMKPAAVRADMAAGGSQYDFSFVRFCSLWDLRHLRDGDWKRKTVNDRLLNSTVEKLITCFVNELDRTHDVIPEAFIPVMAKALKEYPDSSTLMGQCAVIHQLRAHNDKAVKYLKSALLLSPAKFYLWSRLATLIEGDDNRKLRISLCYKALKAPGQRDFKGRIHLAIAEEWHAMGRHDFALAELTNVKNIYTANQWNLPKKYQQLIEAIPRETFPADPTPIYRRIESDADSFLYDALPPVKVRKTYHKDPPASPGPRGYRNMVAWRVTDGEGNHFWFNPRRHNIAEDLPEGTHLHVKLHNGKVVHASLE